jgi:hypothetical protein
VTLEGLLTFIGILVAVLAIARPVQLHSLALFVPRWLLGSAIVLAFALIVCRDAPFGIGPPFGWSLPMVTFGLTVGAFVIPVGAALGSWVSWYRASLTGQKIERVEYLFQAALREHEFDEVERIIRRNQHSLDRLPASAASVLFHPAMVTALLDSHSLVHLDLLSDLSFLNSLQNPLGAVQVVVRESLLSEISPMRSVVVSKYGGLEHLTYTDAQRALIEKTFQKPQWYVASNAHYPLLMAAVEALRSGKLDSDYNDIGRDYEASQGISARAHCPIYIATKTEVLAIEAGIEQRVEKDFYVTDLFDIFNMVQERSKFSQAVWENSNANREYPTPFAYLLHEIAWDLYSLSRTAIHSATSKTEVQRAEPPGEVAHALALTWSLCVWNIAGSEQVGSQFRDHIIEEYLLFVLALGWEPGQIYTTYGIVEGLIPWRDLFMQELQKRFGPRDSAEKAAIEGAIRSLDRGKRFVTDGYEWLQEKLLGRATPM